jgi:predicted nucleotidyltransferase component of viral defense system
MNRKRMINDLEIEAKARLFGINPSDVEKDYVYGWLLNDLYTHSPLAGHLILKGGNGLRKAYLPNTRFSKDLDFSVQHHIDQGFLGDELRKLCDLVEHHAEVHFAKDRTTVRNKNLPMGIDALEARLYFKGFYGDENLTLKAQLDVTQFDRIYLPVQERRLLHPYSDSESCAGMVRCQKIEEILASKLTTLLHRRKAIDLFDLLYTILFTKEFPVERLQVISTFLKKSIFEPQPSVAKEQLLAVPLDDFRPLWTTLVAPVQSLFGFDYVVSNFRTLIESLFEGVLRPLAVAPFPSRGFGRGGIAPGNVRQGAAHADPAYFQWDVRSVIVSAGRSNHLVELVYDGWRRLVEPYSFEYYVRKSDGRGVEYFWGYDTTGGKSGPGIKRFICDKIESVSMSNILFTPQQSVEF